MAVDAAGAVHIAVTGTGRDNTGIWYLTNATGSWVKQIAVTPWIAQDYDEPGLVNLPAIAIDPSDGSVWIGFTYWECADCIPNVNQGVFFVTNAGGTWSEPVMLTGDPASSLSIAVRGGRVFLAWATFEDYFARDQIWFGTDASGVWATQQIAQAGVAPHLVVDAEGRAAVLFGARGIRYARQRPSGDFVVERLPSAAGVSATWERSALAVDSVSGHKWAAWNVPTDDVDVFDVYVAERGPDSWTDPIMAVSGGNLVGLGVRDGVVHVTADKSGITYASNRSGAFAEQVIDGSSAYWWTSAFALGPAGRPFVAYTNDGSGPIGIWLLKGPPV